MTTCSEPWGQDPWNLRGPFTLQSPTHLPTATVVHILLENYREGRRVTRTPGTCFQAQPRFTVLTNPPQRNPSPAFE